MSRPKKDYTDRELLEGKNWTCEVYPENYGDQIQYKIFNRLPSCSGDMWSTGSDFWYIYHDSDVRTADDYEIFKLKNKGEEPDWKPGDKKKSHYHIIVHSSSNCVLHNAARKFGVESNYVEKVGNLRKLVRYLIHIDNPEKHQYSPDEVITNNTEKFEEFLKTDLSTTDKAKMIFEYIYNPDCLNLSSLAQFAIKNNCWDELRRGQHIYTSLLYERKKNNEG